jgi:hypothetical protein
MTERRDSSSRFCASTGAASRRHENPPKNRRIGRFILAVRCVETCHIETSRGLAKESAKGETLASDRRLPARLRRRKPPVTGFYGVPLASLHGRSLASLRKRSQDGEAQNPVGAILHNRVLTPTVRGFSRNARISRNASTFFLIFFPSAPGPDPRKGPRNVGSILIHFHPQLAGYIKELRDLRSRTHTKAPQSRSSSAGCAGSTRLNNYGVALKGDAPTPDSQTHRPQDCLECVASNPSDSTRKTLNARKASPPTGPTTDFPPVEPQFLKTFTRRPWRPQEPEPISREPHPNCIGSGCARKSRLAHPCANSPTLKDNTHD